MDTVWWSTAWDGDEQKAGRETGQKPGRKHILKAAVSDDMVEKAKNISSSDSWIHTMLEH